MVAEASANHCQDFRRAVRLIESAKKCGSDAVKFQAYTPDTLTINADSPIFQIRHSRWGGQTLFSLYRKAYMPWEWLKRLKKVADSLGIVFFATAFDMSSVDLLEEIGVPCHKIASFELVDLPLISYAARTGKPLVLSCGMATAAEIKEAVNAAKEAGAGRIMLLKCVSSYPADPAEVNLRTIPDMRMRFGCAVGISDHSLGTAVSVAACALGAQMVEKHFTLSKRAKSPDSFFSIDPAQLRALVEAVKTVNQALGKVYYGLSAGERQSRIFRPSLFAVQDIEKDEAFNRENIRSIRPAAGLPPKYFDCLLGKKAGAAIKAGTPLSLKVVA